MYHLVIVLALLLAAPPAKTQSIIDTVTGLLKVVDLTSCAKVDPNTKIFADRLHNAYFIYDQSGPSVCCGKVYFIRDSILRMNSWKSPLPTGNVRFHTKADCKGARSYSKFTTVSNGLFGGISSIGYNQLVMLNLAKASLGMLTVLKTYGDVYECIVTETCLFSLLSNSSSKFEGNTYDTMCTTIGLASPPFNITALNNEYQTNLTPVQKRTGCK